MVPHTMLDVTPIDMLCELLREGAEYKLVISMGTVSLQKLVEDKSWVRDIVLILCNISLNKHTLHEYSFKLNIRK